MCLICNERSLTTNTTNRFPFSLATCLEIIFCHVSSEIYSCFYCLSTEIRALFAISRMHLEISLQATSELDKNSFCLLCNRSLNLSDSICHGPPTEPWQSRGAYQDAIVQAGWYQIGMRPLRLSIRGIVGFWHGLPTLSLQDDLMQYGEAKCMPIEDRQFLRFWSLIRNSKALIM